MSNAAGVERHDIEIQRNLEHWRDKPMLRQVYGEFYRQIAARLVGLPAGLLVECGSGIGNLKQAIPECITTDLFPNPWLDRTETVYALSFADSSVAAVVLFDVFHHLQYPGSALRELERVLAPGGKVVLFEPAAGLLGRIVLGLFHREPLAMRRAIEWDAPPAWRPSAASYHAAQGNAWRIFRRGELAERLAPMAVEEVTCFPALPWLVSGGFSGPQLCPRVLAPVVGALDRLLSRAPALFASRMLVVLRKTGTR